MHYDENSEAYFVLDHPVQSCPISRATHNADITQTLTYFRRW